MAYNESLAARIRLVLKTNPLIEERTMFGGLAFLFQGNMCVGVMEDALIVRLGKEGALEALKKPHTKLFDFTGKPMKSILYVLPSGIEKNESLREWVNEGIAYAMTLPRK